MSSVSVNYGEMSVSVKRMDMNAQKSPKRLLDPDAYVIGRRISAIRQARGISIEDVADDVGLAVETLRSIESGHSAKQYAKLARLARALKTTPDEMLGFNGPDDRRILKGAMKAVFDRLGLEPDAAELLAEGLIATSAPPRPGDEPSNRLETARIQAEFLADLLGSRDKK